jgi:predicted ATP-dependent endonuclease of OLD family
MRIRKLDITNLRSIVASGEIPVSNLLAFVGENNAGKSNILIAVGAFLAGGSGGLKVEDFNNSSAPVIIKVTFDELNEFEKKRWRKYLVDGKLSLEKRVWLEKDESAGSHRIKSDYHGYEASPTDWYLSIDRIQQEKGERPKWADIVAEHGLPGYFLEDGKCNKIIYTKALARYLEETDVAFVKGCLGSDQANHLNLR